MHSSNFLKSPGAVLF